MRRSFYAKGMSLVEVLIGISIISVMLVVIGYSINTYVNARAALLNNTKATYLAEEGIEVIRAVRDNDWNTIDALPTNTTRYLSVSTTTFSIVTTPEVIDTNFYREFKVRPVYRNASDDIVASTTVGATVDDGSRQIDMYVGGPAGTTTMQAIITNLYAI
jgi:prepilin-type N-terminal cleavage/methylation domain-containing protein